MGRWSVHGATVAPALFSSCQELSHFCSIVLAGCCTFTPRILPLIRPVALSGASGMSDFAHKGLCKYINEVNGIFKSHTLRFLAGPGLNCTINGPKCALVVSISSRRLRNLWTFTLGIIWRCNSSSSLTAKVVIWSLRSRKTTCPAVSLGLLLSTRGVFLYHRSWHFIFFPYFVKKRTKVKMWFIQDGHGSSNTVLNNSYCRVGAIFKIKMNFIHFLYLLNLFQHCWLISMFPDMLPSCTLVWFISRLFFVPVFSDWMFVSRGLDCET